MGQFGDLMDTFLDLITKQSYVTDCNILGRKRVGNWYRGGSTKALGGQMDKHTLEINLGAVIIFLLYRTKQL